MTDRNYDAMQRAIDERVEYTETVLGRRTGTISEATMRPEDLIEAFLSELEAIADLQGSIGLSAQEKVKNIGITYVSFLNVADEADYETAYNADPDEGGFLLEDLFNALDELSPDGFYFGAHPGDGSDYGYWPVEFLD